MANTPLVSLFNKEIFVKMKHVAGTARVACRLFPATFCLCDIPKGGGGGAREEGGVGLCSLLTNSRMHRKAQICT